MFNNKGNHKKLEQMFADICSILQQDNLSAAELPVRTSAILVNIKGKRIKVTIELNKVESTLGNLRLTLFASLEKSEGHCRLKTADAPGLLDYIAVQLKDFSQISETLKELYIGLSY